MQSLKFIIFSDFDGTITKIDTLDKIITDVYSFEYYKFLEQSLIENKLDYNNYLYDTFNNIKYNLTNLTSDIVDEYFFSFYNWTINSNINFYIISSGFKKIISTLLPYVNKNIIYANNIEIKKKKWYVKLYDNINKISINKNAIINKLKNEFLDEQVKTIYIGDGLSDFTVIDNVDIIFCKENSLFHKKCIEKNIKFYTFNTFNDIYKICITL